MNATKYSVTIRIEVLDLGSVGGLIGEVCRNIGTHHKNISIQKTDGDLVSVTVEVKSVEM